jgi:methylmalonyl-CoA mutase N-terminal domain/subunit
VGLFGKSKERRQALLDRIAQLEGLPVELLAEELMQGAWGPTGAKPDGETLTELEIIKTIATSLPPPQAIQPLKSLVAQGMTALETTGLVVHHVGEQSDSSSRRWEPTSAGTSALGDGTVAERVRAAHPGL